MQFSTIITRTAVLAVVLLTVACTAAHAQYQGGIWRPASGPYGGTINALIAASDGSMIVGTPAGLYRSTDNGGNWSQQIGLLPIAPVYALARDSAGVLYAATMSGIFRSTSNGEKWDQLDIGSPAAHDARSLAIYNGTRLIAGGLNRTYLWDTEMKVRTTYNYTLNPNSTYLTALAVYNGVVYAGTSDAGFFRSEIGTNTMEPMEGLPCTTIYSMELRPIDLTGGFGLAVGTSCGVYSWATHTPAWTEFAGPLSGRPVGAVKLVDSTLFAGTKGFGIFRTFDGINWTEVYNGMENPTINTIEANPNGSIFCGTQHGVQRSDNMGERWEAVSRGIRATNIRSVLVDDKEYIFTSTETGIYRSGDTGASWQEKNYLLTDRNVQCIAMDYDIGIWAGTRNGKLFGSIDDGESWEEINFISGSPIESIILDYNGVLYVCTSGSEGGVYSSPDRGVTWNKNLSGDFRSMAMNQSNLVYAVATDQGLYVKEISGRTWNRIMNLQGYYSVAACPDKVVIGGPNRIMISVNGSWKITKIPPCGSIKSMLFDESNNLLIGTGCSTYRSLDDGLTWLEDRTGLNARQVTSLGRRRSFSRFVVAGTDGAGIYLRNNTTASAHAAVSQGDISAVAIRVAADAITLDIHRAGHYVVTLHDPAGRQIAIVADREFDIGSHQITQSFDEFASGVYLLQARGNGSTATTKVVVER